MLSSKKGRKRLGTITLSLFVWTWLVAPTAVSAKTIEVPAGTTVLCAFSTAIEPSTATVGQRLTLRVVDAVKVDGVVVIEAGAAVTAEVTRSQKKGAVGKPAVIGVTLFSVAAVDGSSIPLTGQKVIEGESKQTSSLVITILCCVLGLLQKGGDATIPEGSQINGTTPGMAKVEA